MNETARIITAPVSVVIPCYRCSATILRAIESIKNQTVKPVEVILVEDGSGDGTRDVLRSIEQDNSGWIQIIFLEKNLGAASARNAGWEVATQPYIAFLDADDTWHPEKLRIQYSYLKSNPEVVLCGHQCILSSEGSEPRMLPKSTPTKIISSRSLLFRNAFSTPTVMIKSNIPFRFSDGKRYAEDVQLWQQIAFSGFNIVRIEMPLAHIYKAAYGVGGLSAHTMEMEMGELDNFLLLYRRNKIDPMMLVLVCIVSAIKFLKRLLVQAIRTVF